MHLRYGKTDIDLPVAFELCQLLYNGSVIQVGEAGRNKFSLCFQAGGFIQVVITAEIIFIQQQVNLFATLATEIFVFHPDGCAVAYVSAVITINRYV